MAKPPNETKWFDVLEHHPTAWFIIGLAIVLLAESSIQLTLGKSSIALLPPIEDALKAALRVTGFTLVIAFTYLYLSSRVTEHKKVVFLALLTVWLLTMGLCTYAYLSNNDPGPKITSWDYDLERSEFTVTLTPNALRAHEGNYLVLVARKRDDRVSFNDDPNVIFSSPFPVVNKLREENYSVDMKAKSREIFLGDWLECQVVVVVEKEAIDNAKRIADLIANGGKPLFTDPPRVANALKTRAVHSLLHIIDSLEPNDKEALVSKLKKT